MRWKRRYWPPGHILCFHLPPSRTSLWQILDCLRATCHFQRGIRDRWTEQEQNGNGDGDCADEKSILRSKGVTALETCRVNGCIEDRVRRSDWHEVNECIKDRARRSDLVWDPRYNHASKEENEGGQWRMADNAKREIGGKKSQI